MTWYEDQDQYVVDTALPRAFIGDLNQGPFRSDGPRARGRVRRRADLAGRWGTRARDDKPVFMQNYLSKEVLARPPRHRVP